MATPARMVRPRSAPKKKPVVIDLGSAFIRCGFAGDARPIHVVPSVIGDALDGVSAGARARTTEEWADVLTEMFSRLYTESLQCRPRERRVILCESMVSPRPLREAVAHVLFRYLQVPSLHICAGPAPALYCTGMDTGVVVDVGSREAHVVAVYRGALVARSYAGIPLGARAVHERVGELLAEEEARLELGGEGEGERRRSLSSRELEDVAVRACLVPVKGVPSPQQVSPMEFMFSGRRKVTVSSSVRTTAVQEAFFEGDEEGRTLATLFLDCLQRSPRDCRRALAQNVVLAGGGSLFPGLCGRLGEEIRALALGTGDSGSQASQGVGNPEGYAWARAVVAGDGDGDRGEEGSNSSGGGRGGGAGGGLCVVKVPVRRDVLLWTGASIMTSLGGVGERSLTNEQYLAREGGHLPDWMSISPADWLFEAAPVATV